MHASARRPLLLVAAAVFAVSCGPPPVDLKQGLEISVVGTGWFDAGLVEDGKNKLVPTVSFTIKNVSDQTLISLQMMGSFFRVSDTNSEWGNTLLTVARSEGLAPGATTPVLTIRSPLGYTGTEPRDEMLRNSHFVDAMVKLVAKYGSVQWTHVKEVPIERQLITQ
jgi:hypothetical protein